MSHKIDPQFLLDTLAENHLFDFLGVPDSTLEPLIKVIEKDSRFSHLIATNECEAVSIAMGQYLASGNPSVVYLQNSGLGKTVHPITSLLAKEICNIPALLIVGHRGHPRVKDEPQHKCLGRILPDILKAIEVPFCVLENQEEKIREAIALASKHLQENKTPFALIVPPDLLSPLPKEEFKKAEGLIRSEVINEILKSLSPHTFYVSTTGKISRELYFLREERQEDHTHDFYTVGGMGCASSIALGISRKRPNELICVLDGDGAALMQLGSWASIGSAHPKNFIHIILDNECYESTGRQPSLSPHIDFIEIAKGAKYSSYQLITNEDQISLALKKANTTVGPHLLVIKVSGYSDPKLGRPDRTPKDNAEDFKNALIKNKS